MAQIERLGRISEQFLVARKCVFAWKMLRKWHKKQKKPLLGAKSLGRLFYQNNLPNMAYLPLMDTMHHTLKAWCIFYWFHFDSQGRWGQKGQNAECSPRSLLSAVPEAFCRQIISGMFLVNVQKQRAKNARVRLFLFCRAILGSCAFSFQRQLPGIF